VSAARHARDGGPAPRRSGPGDLGRPRSAPRSARTSALASLTRERWRQLGAFLFVAVVAAIITGPTGNADHPFHAARRSVFAPRIIIFLAIALALWIAVIGWSRARDAATPVARRLWAPAGATLARPVGRVGLNLVLLAIAIVAPLVVSPAAQTSMFVDIGLYALLALGLNVVVGYAGLLDLGYIAFFAVGAYVTAYVSSKTAMPWHAPFTINPFFAFPIALAVAGLAGVILGAPTLRLRGDYLAIVTLGFGEIIQLIANNSDDITNGARGVFGVPHLSVHVLGINYDWGINPRPYYYLVLAIIVIVMAAFGRLERSRIGRAWAAIREDEIAAEASGVPTLRLKLLAFAIGASVSGFAGVLFATKQFFSPQTFSLQASFLVVTVVIFGGMGSRLGVVLGSVILQGLAFYLRGKVPAADRYIYFGAVVIVMMIFRPQGVLPSTRRRREIEMAESGVGGADALGPAPTGGQAA
jgi:branched-chain amino acid transport system permease protein